MMIVSSTPLVFLCILQLIPGFVYANVVTTQIGGIARLNCSTTAGGLVEWKRKLSTKGSAFIFSYIYANSLLQKWYESGRRHNISLDAVTGVYDLVLTNVTESDAGRYICTETEKRRESIVELVVLLESNPTCGVNISLNSVLLDNDCNVDPDYIQFNCSVAYRGNVAPAMQLQITSIGVLDNVIIRTWERSTASYSSILWASKASFQMRDQYFQCHLRNTTNSIDPSCSSGRVSVMYFYNSSRTLMMLSDYNVASHQFVTCAANTSESCSYTWQTRHQNNSKESALKVFGPTIDLIGNSVDRCRAECRIRNSVCVAEPIMIRIGVLADSATFPASGNYISAIVVPIILLVVAVIVLITLRKYISIICSLTRCRRRMERTMEESYQLVDQMTADSILYFIKENRSTLEETLDTDDGLAMIMRSKKALTEDDYVRITKELANNYLRQNRELLDIIAESAKSGESILSCTSFIYALRNTNQRHVANYIHEDHENIQDKYCRILNPVEKDSIIRNKYELANLMKIKYGFLAYLLNRECISKRQKERIDAHCIKSDQTEELLSIIARRSYADFEKFKSALRKTNQENIIQILDRGTGCVASVHLNATSHNEASDSSEDNLKLEKKILKSINAVIRQKLSTFREYLSDLVKKEIILIGASPGGSIIVFFICKTFQSVLSFKELLDSERLKEIMEEIFNNCILKSSRVRMQLTVSYDKDHFRNWIEEARKTIYFETSEKICEIRQMPMKILQKINRKAIIITLGRTFRETCFSANTHGYKHKRENMTSETIMRCLTQIAVDAFNCMSSVSFMLFKESLKRQRIKQQCITEFLANVLYKSESTVIERLSASADLIDQFQDVRGISQNEERIEPELVRYLITGNYTNVFKFFQLLDQTKQSDLLNFIIDNSGCKTNMVNMAKFVTETHKFKQRYRNERTRKYHQLKIRRTTTDELTDVLEKFDIRATQPLLDKINLIKNQWRTMQLWEIVQSVNPCPILEFGGDELVKRDDTLPENLNDRTLRWSIVICCIFEDLMKSFKVGDTLDIEEDICDVVGNLMMKVVEEDRPSVLISMQRAVVNIHAHGSERDSDRMRTLLITKEEYNGLKLAGILLEQMIIDYEDTINEGNLAWMRVVCEQFIDLVVQRIIEPDYRKYVHWNLKYLMKLNPIWSVADIYNLMRKCIFKFHNQQGELHQYLITIRNFAVPPSLAIPPLENNSTLRFNDDTNNFIGLDNEVNETEKDKSLDQVLNELKKNEVDQAEQHLIRKIIENSFSKKVQYKGVHKGGIEQELERIRNSKQSDDIDMLSSCLYIVSMALYSCKNYWPLNTQLVSYCLLVARQIKDKGRLLEISTGEGKSCVIAMVAATYALLGRSVDIVTSSIGLSQRDADEWRAFYNRMELSADCNAEDNREEEHSCYESNVIVYGTVETFARDILKTEFLLQSVRKDRKCDIVIVDEVDSMLIDQGVQCTYLSQDVSSYGLRFFEPILRMIWMNVRGFICFNANEKVSFYRTEPEVFIVSLSRISNGIDPLQIVRLAEEEDEQNGIRIGFTDKYLGEDIEGQKRLLSSLNQSHIEKFFNFAKANLNLDIDIYTKFDSDRIVKDQEKIAILVLDDGLSSVVSDEKIVKDRLAKMITDVVSDGDENTISLPFHLRGHYEKRLRIWIDNAFMAKQMQYDREYIVEDYAIYPVDYKSTGVIETNKKWGDGLQQFLEMKHCLHISALSLITNFLSNIDFFDLYGSNIFGVSGTLGNASDKRFMNDIFSVAFATIPTSKRRKLFEIDGKILKDKYEWQSVVLKTVFEITENQRAVLVICEDIATANNLKKFISSEYSEIRIYLYIKGAVCEKNQMKEKLMPRDVVITTNLGARGTDFITDDTVNKNGGLFVLVTFIPLNDRVEKQAFGRTGRRGATGSCQIITKWEAIPKFLRRCETVHEAKRLHDSIAEMHLSNEMKEVDAIRNKQYLLREYCKLKKHFRDLVTSSFFYSNDLKIQLELLDETWAIWMQDHETPTRESNSEMVGNLTQVITDCSELAKQFKSDNIYHLLKFGAVRLKKGDFEGASQFYEKVILMDPAWSAFAHYNRAYCAIHLKGDGYIRRAIDDLNCTLSKLEIHKTKTLFSEIGNAAIVDKHFSECNINKTNEMNSRLTRYYIMMECQLLHHIDTQIIGTILILNTIETMEGELKTEFLNILDSIPGTDCMIEKMLQEYSQLGLLFTYNIDKKPKFCFNNQIVSSIALLGSVAETVVIAMSSGMLVKDDLHEFKETVKAICNIRQIRDDSLMWMPRCVSRTITSGVHFIRDVSTLVPIEQTELESSCKINTEESQFRKLTVSQRRSILELLTPLVQEINKLLDTQDELLLNMTNTVTSVLRKTVEQKIHEKIDQDQKLHRELCCLSCNLKLQCWSDQQQFYNCISDLSRVSAYAFQLSNTNTDALRNLAVELLTRFCNDNKTGADLARFEITTTESSIEIECIITKFLECMCDQINRFNQETKAVFPCDNYHMQESKTKVFESVWSDIIHEMFQSRITRSVIFDLQEKIGRLFISVNDALSVSTDKICNLIDTKCSTSDQLRNSKVSADCSLLLRKYYNSLKKSRCLYMRSMTDVRMISENLHCNIIIFDDNEEIIFDSSSPENFRTAILEYNKPCDAFPGGRYNFYRENNFYYVPLKGWDFDDDYNMLFSAVVYSLDHQSSTNHLISEKIDADPRGFGEILASDQYACQIKRGRALFRLDMNSTKRQKKQYENVVINQSHFHNCIQQALEYDNVSPLAKVLANYESESRCDQITSLEPKTEITTSPMTRDACQLFLSSGSSVEADVYRKLVLEKIDDEDINTALMLCCIGHQIRFCQNIINSDLSISDAHTLRVSFEQMLKKKSREHEKNLFLLLCNEWYEVLEPQGLMNIEQLSMLKEWIRDGKYAEAADPVVSLLSEKCLIAQKEEEGKKRAEKENREVDENFDDVDDGDDDEVDDDDDGESESCSPSSLSSCHDDDGADVDNDLKDV